jgi:hypothetical protein
LPQGALREVGFISGFEREEEHWDSWDNTEGSAHSYVQILYCD